MRRILSWSRRAFLWQAMLLWICGHALGRGEILLHNNFESGLENWQITGNGKLLKSLSGKAFVLLQLESSTEEIAGLLSPSIPILKDQALELRFRYRSSVANSSQDRGSWVWVQFMDSSEKMVAKEAIICPQAEQWNDMAHRMSYPPTATHARLAFRVQEQIGHMELDGIVIASVPIAVEVKDEVKEEKSQRLLLELNLAKRRGEMTLSNEKVSLPNLSHDAAYFSFMLPDEFCENPELIYQIEAEFKPSWNSNPDAPPHALFTLGRNMQGAMPNSFSLMFWAENLFARLTSFNVQNKSEVIWRQPQTTKGQTCRLQSRFGVDEVALVANGQMMGREHLSQSFLWPKGRPFFIGAEDDKLSLLDGEILGFSLKVFEPKIKVEIAGGRDVGYYVGAGPHPVEIAFRSGQGNTTESVLRVRNTHGEIICSDLKPTRKTPEGHSFLLPVLPYGWYQWEVEATAKEAEVKKTRSFVVMPFIPQRSAASESPFGITQELALSPSSYDAATVEALFKLLAQMGVRWFRVWLLWDDIEFKEGVYQWEGLDQLVATAQKHGVELYVCLCGGSQPFQMPPPSERPNWEMTARSFMPPKLDLWKKYVGELARRYQGRIRYYQVWNEPDTKAFFYPFKAESYLELLKTTAEKLRAVDPHCVVGLGGFAAALMGKENLSRVTHGDSDSSWGGSEFYALKPQSHFDIVDAHFYSVDSPGQLWEGRMALVEELKKFMEEQGESRKPIWNSETSFISAEGSAVGQRGGWAKVPLLSEEVQAIRLAQWHVQSLAAGIQKSFWYLIEGECGVIHSDFSPKPSYAAHAVLAQLMSGLRYVETLSLGPNLRGYRFSGKDRSLVAVWTLSGKELLAVVKKKEAPILVVDLMGNEKKLDPSKESAVMIGEGPIYLESSESFAVKDLISLEVPLAFIPNQPLEIELTFQNPTKVDTAYTVAFMGSSTSDKAQVSLKPGEMKVERMTLLSSGEPPKTLRLEGVATGGIFQDFLIERPCSFRKSFQLREEGEVKLEVNRAEQVKVGGPQKDLQGRIFSESCWKGENDLSMTGTLRRSNGRVSFEFYVHDDYVCPVEKSSPALWNGDCVEIFLDMRSKAMAGAEQIFQVLIGADGRIWSSSKKLPEGFEAKVEPAEKGYQVKGGFSLPLDRKSFGFDVALDDADDGKGRKTQMVWVGTEDDYKTADSYALILLTP